MAFEYDDGDLGLDDEDLEDCDGSENEYLDEDSYLQELFGDVITDDEESEDSESEETFDYDESHQDNDEEVDGTSDTDTKRNKKGVDDDKLSSDTLDTASQNQSSGKLGDTPPSQNLNTQQNTSPSKIAEISSQDATAATKDATKRWWQKSAQAGSRAGRAGAATAGTATTTAAASGTTAAAGSGAAALFTNPYFWIAVAAVLLIILIIVLIFAISAHIEAEAKKGTLTFETITSKYFYGMRLAYCDEDILSEKLQLSYKQYAIDILNIIDEHEDAELTISLPAEFDNSTEIDPNITNISISIGNIVANGHSNYENIEFSSLYKFIPYFGLSSSNLDDVCSFLSEYISTNSIVAIDSESSVTITELINLARWDSRTQYISNLCEKVIIQDVITDENGIASFGSHQFIGAIYMSKGHVVASDMSYIINFEEDVEVTTSLINKIDTAKYEISSTSEDFLQAPDDFEYRFTTFESVDVDSLEKYSDGMLLFDIIKTEDKKFFSTYFDMYTWIPPDEHALYLSFESNGKFQFNELIITCKDPSD